MTVYLTDEKGNEVGKFDRRYDARFFNVLRLGFNGYKLEAEIMGIGYGSRNELRINIIDLL